MKQHKAQKSRKLQYEWLSLVAVNDIRCPSSETGLEQPGHHGHFIIITVIAIISVVDLYFLFLKKRNFKIEQ